MMRKATQCVPFSCLFYTSRPLEAALTRRLTQVCFALFGLFVLWKTQSSSLELVPKSHYLRFTILEQRSTIFNACQFSEMSCHHSSPYGLAHVGLMLNDAYIKESHINFSQGEIFISFANPVDWNAWYFVTSTDHGPEHDPVRFVLHSYQGGKWHVVGSSSHWKFLSGVVFFHTSFYTPIERGSHVTFNVFKRNQDLEAFSSWIPICQMIDTVKYGKRG